MVVITPYSSGRKCLDTNMKKKNFFFFHQRGLCGNFNITSVYLRSFQFACSVMRKQLHSHLFCVLHVGVYIQLADLDFCMNNYCTCYVNCQINGK